MNEQERDVIREILVKCGEYLEHIPQKHWRYYVTPVLIKQLAKAREEIEILRKRLEDVSRINTK